MLAAFDAACCAANGVPLRDPRKPSEPELFHASTFPLMSEMVTMVLLKEACTCTSPCGTCLRSFFLNVFFLPFFSGAAAAPPAAVAFAIVSIQWSVVGGQSSVDQKLCWPPISDHWTLFLCLCRRLFLLRDSSLARAFAGARIGVRALAANRQVSPVAKSAIGTDFDETLDVHRNLLAQVALDHSFRLDDRADAIDLFLVQVLDLFHGVHFGLVENVYGSRLADAVDVSQRDIDVLLARKIDACDTCHSCSLTPRPGPSPGAACVSS